MKRDKVDKKFLIKVCGLGKHYSECDRWKRNKHGCAKCGDAIGR